MDLLAQYSDDDEEVVISCDKGSKKNAAVGGDGHGKSSKPADPRQRPPGAMAKASAGPKKIGNASMLDDSYGPGMEIVALPSVNTAPMVDLLGMDAVTNYAINPADKRILTNPSIGAMCKPLAGPVEVGRNNLEEKYQNHKCGHVEKAACTRWPSTRNTTPFTTSATLRTRHVASRVATSLSRAPRLKLRWAELSGTRASRDDG